MLAYIKGDILAHTKDGAVIRVGDLGYEIMGSWLGKIPSGSSVEIWTYQYFENESVPRLIGCKTPEARHLFIALLAVSGVGPKMAGRIVDYLEPAQLIKAISSGDLTSLGSVKGLGKKTAQKIILELGKTLVSVNSSDDPLVEALSSLKFTPQEISQAIESTDLTGLSEKDKLTTLLRVLGRNR